VASQFFLVAWKLQILPITLVENDQWKRLGGFRVMKKIRYQIGIRKLCLLVPVLAAGFAAGCSNLEKAANALVSSDPEVKTVQKKKVDQDLIRQAAAVAIAETKSLAIKNEVPTITAVGYASVSAQPSKSRSEQRLMAIQAARVLALRKLTEQVHGVKIDGDTTVFDAVIQNDTVRSRVSGMIRGARTVRVNPLGSDNYEVVLELDRETIRSIVSAVL
tara:strand:- start:131 stop:784 length:654 start_codon:yes stop_codon:yes gene_type:complete